MFKYMYIVDINYFVNFFKGDKKRFRMEVKCMSF